MLRPVLLKDFQKQYQKLPQPSRQKFQKQLKFLIKDYHHSSLHSRKMAGLNRFEARIDRRYRFTFTIVEKEIWLLSIGPPRSRIRKKMMVE